MFVELFCVVVRGINSIFAGAMLLLIRLYQILLSPFIGGQCRFQPTCSRYGQQAIRLHGPWKGGWLTVNRIRRCHPLNEGGDDPVPEQKESAKKNVQ